jgi:hypothetical protein
MADKATTKVLTLIEQEAGIDSELAEELSFGQAHWWLREDGGEFVALGKRVRGDKPLSLKVELEPGTYILGVGPAEEGVRFEIEVEPPDTEAKIENAANVEGKTFVFTGDLDCMGRDEAKALLQQMGARVTGSVSGKTDYLVIGAEPGQSKISKATSLGTEMLDEKQFVALAGIKLEKIEPKDNSDIAQAYLKRISLSDRQRKAAEKFGSPENFEDMGQHGQVLWGLAVGPRGGRYAVYVDMKNKNQRYGLQCNCSSKSRPCAHAVGLVMAAANHWLPPAPPPEGHRDEARDRYSFWE